MKNIVSFSGGKDSAAMLLLMIEKGIKIDQIVFADTGLEYPEMYDYINLIEKEIGIPILKLKTHKKFDDRFNGNVTRGKNKGKIRGFPLTLFPCYWARESKVNMLSKICKGNNVYIGISLSEKKRVKANPKFNAIYPLVERGLTGKDCLEYLKNKKLLNPLYNKFKRTGCWLCPKQSKKSLYILFKEYPLLWEKLKEYQSKDSKKFNKNYSIFDLEKEFIKHIP